MPKRLLRTFQPSKSDINIDADNAMLDRHESFFGGGYLIITFSRATSVQAVPLLQSFLDCRTQDTERLLD